LQPLHREIKMNCKRTLLALSLGLSFSFGLIACNKSQPQTQPQPSSSATNFAPGVVTAVPENALQACKAEIARLAPQSQANFRIYDYQPQQDGTALLLWRTSEKEAGSCKIDPDGKVLQLSTGEEGIIANNSSVTAAKPATVKPAGTTGTPRSAVLDTKDAGSRVNVRSKPSTDASAAHYGVDGDRVKVLNEAPGNDGYTWYYIKFEESGAEGWVRGDLINLTTPSTASNATTTNIPAGLISACRKRTAEEFQAKESEIEVTNSQLQEAGTYAIYLRSTTTGASANCQVNQSGNIIAWVARPQSGEDPATMCDPKKGPC
jgi:uncharacterized protein YgiM (DUF1202 family)